MYDQILGVREERRDFDGSRVLNAVCGIGSASCAPVLDEKYQIPKEGQFSFRFTLDREKSEE